MEIISFRFSSYRATNVLHSHSYTSLQFGACDSRLYSLYPLMIVCQFEKQKKMNYSNQLVYSFFGIAFNTYFVAMLEYDNHSTCNAKQANVPILNIASIFITCKKCEWIFFLIFVFTFRCYLIFCLLAPAHQKSLLFAFRTNIPRNRWIFFPDLLPFFICVR